MASKAPGPPVPLKAVQEKIALAWDNAPDPSAWMWITGVEGSTNLADWYLITVLPYSTAGFVVLTNRPLAEYYRVYNAIKL